MHRHAVAAAAVALTCFAIMASQASPPEGCLLPPETGMCEALFTRYAYDVKSGACVTFVYGGCGGNANNFESENQCINTCIGATTTPGLSSSSSSAD